MDFDPATTKTYVERNEGKLRLYRITSKASKHTRTERVGEKIVPIVYGYGSRGERNEILLTEAGAKSLAHLGLVPIVEAIARREVHVPADWDALPLADKCEIANKINPKTKHKSHAACEKTIRGYLGTETD